MTQPISVIDPADPRIAAFRDVRERDLVGREGRFVAEGEVVLRVLLTASRHRAEAILIAEHRAERLGPLLALAPEGVPVYSAPQGVLDGIAGFPLHRGILAIGRRAEAAEAGSLLNACPERALVVVLYGIGNHDNLGGIFRNAAAFGADAVLLASDCCDPLYRKAIRVSVGACLIVPFAKLASGEDAVELLARHSFETLSLSPSGAETLAGLRRPERVAALFGSEGPGLPRQLLARTRTVRIPMARGFDSLNVATTSGIVMHHLAAAER